RAGAAWRGRLPIAALWPFGSLSWGDLRALRGDSGLGCRFLLAGDRSGLALARARVGVCALASDRQAGAMAPAAGAAKVRQPLDIHGDVSPQVALHDVVAVDRLADLQHLRVGQLVDPALFGNARLLANLLGKFRSNAVNVLKRNDHALLRWNVDACDASHVGLPATAACHCPTPPAVALPLTHS